MSSSLIVEVCKIKEIIPHKNADLLEILVIKGWECISKKGEFKVGDSVVYIPVDSVLPVELADRIGVRNYLAGKNKDRVKCAKLRGEMSYGLIIPNEENWEVGTDVREFYNIEKYNPPVRAVAGDAAPQDPLFDKYTDIENIKNFPDIFEEGEMVVVTEKIDGSNDRIGFELVEKDGSTPTGTIDWKAGSHRLKRKEPETKEEMKTNIYWFPHTLEPVKKLLLHLAFKVKKTATLYGEVYGRVRGGHKSMHYGKPNSLNFAAFSLKIDGKYVNQNYFESLCKEYGVPMVPVIAITKFNIEEMKKLSTGPSILAKENGADHIREGVVICSVEEREEWECSRAILKMLNPDFLLMKNKREAKGEVVDFVDE